MPDATVLSGVLDDVVVSACHDGDFEMGIGGDHGMTGGVEGANADVG